MVARTRALSTATALLALVVPAFAQDAKRVALRCDRLITMDANDSIYEPGMILVNDGKLEYVGEPIEVPEGVAYRELEDCWMLPGMIDLHSHIHTGGWGDINGMVLPVNPEFRTSPTIKPSNRLIRRACAAGVTMLFGIGGSGTSISSFGVLYKTKHDARYEETIFADPGGMKVAQTHNPERRAGDLGQTRAGLSWILADINDKARAANEQGRFDLQLENLKRVHRQDLPVLIHCAGNDGVANTVRMWKIKYDTRCVISHGSFDGWYCAKFAADNGVPVNHGPRTMNYRSGYSEGGKIVGTGHEYVKAGVPNFSLNTDAGVVPQEELFLQGAMSAWLGADSYEMLKAVTIHPARSFHIDDRVGSLETGKDADVVLWSGDPLDPRSRVELVLIDGRIQYDPQREGRLY